MSFQRKCYIYLTIIPSLILLLTLTNHANAKELTLGIHPYKSASKLLKAYRPLAELLSKHIGQSITIKISKDYKSHIDLIGRNQLDIAYLGPASYIKLIQQYGKKPLLVRQVIRGSPTFQGKIFYRKGAPITSIKDLKGKRFAFGDPNSTMSHLVPRYMLWQSGIHPDNLASHAFLGSHDNVALGVLNGDFDAGATKEAVFYKYQNRGLIELTTTPPLSEHVFVSSTALPKIVTSQLQHALLQLHKTKAGLSAMHSIKPSITAMQKVSDEDYKNLRKILTTLTDLGVKW